MPVPNMRLHGLQRQHEPQPPQILAHMFRHPVLPLLDLAHIRVPFYVENEGGESPARCGQVSNPVTDPAPRVFERDKTAPLRVEYTEVQVRRRRHNMKFEDLTPEQQEKARACKTPEDIRGGLRALRGRAEQHRGRRGIRGRVGFGVGPALQRLPLQNGGLSDADEARRGSRRRPQPRRTSYNARFTPVLASSPSLSQR